MIPYYVWIPMEWDGWLYHIYIHLSHIKHHGTCTSSELPSCVPRCELFRDSGVWDEPRFEVGSASIFFVSSWDSDCLWGVGKARNSVFLLLFTVKHLLLPALVSMCWRRSAEFFTAVPSDRNRGQSATDPGGFRIPQQSASSSQSQVSRTASATV